MKLGELLKGVKIREINADLNTEVKGLCYNSKDCHEGYGYFARKGFKYDGFLFIPTCFKRGVSVFFGEEALSGYPFVVVDNIREAQALISANFYGNPQRFLKLVGVTGTNGKTTTCYLLKDALNSGLISTVEIDTGKRLEKARLTTPESTDIFCYLKEMVESGKQYAVIEVSAHALTFKRVHGMKFDSVVFTGFSRDHLDFYKTMDNYFKAKASLFGFLKGNGFCVVNGDVDVFDRLVPLCKNPICVGKGERCHIKIKRIVEEASSLFIDYLIGGKEVSINFPMIGEYNAYNLGFALGVLSGFNIATKGFIERVSQAFSVPGRVEVINSGKGFKVIIDFAHTPEGLDKLLHSLKKHCKNKLITVFGCGGERDKTKRPLMLESVCKHSDLVFVTADNPRGESIEDIFNDIKKGRDFKKQVTYIKDRKEAIFEAIDQAGEGDLVVIAGKGHEDYQIIGETPIPFNDKQVALEALGLV